MSMLRSPLGAPVRPLARKVTEAGGGYGPNIVVNGDFGDALVGWTVANTAPATISAASGAAVWDCSGGGTGRLRQVISTVPGATYEIACSWAGLSFAVGTAAGLSDVLSFRSVPSARFTATTSLSHLSFVSTTNGATLDNVTVRVVIGDKGIRTLRTEGDSYRGGAGGVVLPTTMQTTLSRAVQNTGVGSSDMAGIRSRVIDPGRDSLLHLITVFWDGSHNGYTSNSQYLGELQDAITALGHSRFVVIPPAVPYASTKETQESIASAMQAAWPNNYLDWRSYIAHTNGVINQDRMLNYPTDTVHLNQTAMNEMAAGIKTFIESKGW